MPVLPATWPMGTIMDIDPHPVVACASVLCWDGNEGKF